MPQTAAIHFDTAAAVIMLVTLSSFVLRRMTKGAINRIYIVAMALVTITNMLYQNIGRVVGATLLAVARQGLMFIPVVLILPRLFSTPVWGVYLAQPTADLFAFSLALPLAIRMFRELTERERAKKEPAH